MLGDVKTLYDCKVECPCYRCADRFVGCHGVCKKYSEWHNTKESIKRKIQTAKLDESMKNEADIKGTKRRKKGFWR